MAIVMATAVLLGLQLPERAAEEVCGETHATVVFLILLAGYGAPDAFVAPPIPVWIVCVDEGHRARCGPD